MRRSVRGAWMGVGLLAAVLAAAPSPSPRKLAGELGRAIAAGEDEKVHGLVGQLAARDAPKAAEELLKIAQLSVPQRYFRQILDGLARMEGCDEYFLKAFARSKAGRKIILLQVATRMKGDRGGDILVAALADRNLFVLRWAVEAARVRRLKVAIVPLIDLLDRLTGKRRDTLYYEVRDALTEITGQDFDAIQDWRNWWAGNGKAFNPKAPEAGRTRVRRKVRGGRGDPTFFGVPIASKNAVFVIDVSRSMLICQKDDIPGLAGVDDKDDHTVLHEPDEELTEENRRLAEYWMRIAMAKRALLKVLSGLASDTRFNIIAFHTRVIPWKKTSQRASATARKSAGRWVKGLEAQLHTNTLDALEAAFRSDPNLNTIYFLSDGIPMKDGKNPDPTGPILDRVLELDRYRSVRIHTFGFYPALLRGGLAPQLEQANEFLKELASKTGGTFTYMKVDPKEKPPNGRPPALTGCRRGAARAAGRSSRR